MTTARLRQIIVGHATKKLKKRRAQFEDRVLWGLRLALPDHVHVTVLADRGFADTGLFWKLQEKMRFDYVIRFKAGTFVESADGDARPAVSPLWGA